MKTVHPSDMVAHLWANKAQSEARTPTKNLYFEGDTIYSYGTHFPIARHVVNKKGFAAVLFTTRSYSVTTSKHLGLTAYASHHLKKYYVTNPRDSFENSFYIQKEIERVDKSATGLLAKAARARDNKTRYTNEAKGIIQNVNELAAFYGCKSRCKLPDEKKIRAILATEKEQNKKDRAAYLARLEASKAEIQERITKWLSGDKHVSTSGFPEVYLRARGDIVQTSRGAVIPLSDAQRVIVFIRNKVACGFAWEADPQNGGLQVGAFTVTKISAHGDVTAGCHFIKGTEVERFANTLTEKGV